MSTNIQWEGERLKNEQRKKHPSKCSTATQIPINYLEQYRRFLQRNRIVINLLEDGLSRLVLYAPSRFVSQSEDDSHDHDKILPETLYAIINMWSLLNDAVHYGFGRGNGFTVGSVESLSAIPESSDDIPKMEHKAKAIMLFRTILSVVECMAPSLEVAAYFRHGVQTVKTRKSNHYTRHLNALNMSSKIEKIKFICRMGLFALNYSEQIKSLTFKKENPMNILSNMGVLHDGGLLEPGEHITSSIDESTRVKKLIYVGKRTRRQMQYGVKERSKTMPLATYTSPMAKIGMLLLGELVHIYRPLYYVQSSVRHHGDDNKAREGMIKSWIISLVMDLLSQQLIIAGKTVRKGDSGCFVDISSDSTKDEIYRRKMRLTLYLLRSPVWNMATYPVAERISNIIAFIPLVGKPLVEYVMDILNYWQRWHFMLEG